MSKRFSFAAGAVVAAVAVGALLLGLPGVQAEGGIVAVHATDGGYQGVPRTLKVGEIRFSFTNDSQTQAHEMNLFRINDGVKQTFDQILAEDEAQQNQPPPDQAGGESAQNPPAEQAPPPPKMTFFGATGAGPGEAAKMDLIGNLPPGRYGMASFIPSDDEAGTPGYKKGLKAEFTVQK
ncbi:MAG TPA: hypothetical protein VEG38_23220 [Acidimicrobiia bacterium]|nr:hypothetical protein [Acidimicrobiia bacterium]